MVGSGGERARGGYGLDGGFECRCWMRGGKETREVPTGLESINRTFGLQNRRFCLDKMPVELS